MDQDLRNALRRAVTALRRLLERSAREQLEGTFGVLPTGELRPVAQVPPLVASAELRRRRDDIAAALEHLARQEPAGAKPAERRAAALERFAREAAFTLLNRLAALELMERRGLVPECVSKGPESAGFREFRQLVPTLCQAQPDGGYRLFLDLLFDDVAAEVRVLFDRTLPPSYLVPEGAVLGEVLALLNDPELAPAWDVDETLGWVYQYFTPKEQRDAARKASAAPRNAYELSFRNQFYTPDYVVRFLVENTLGRMWWEMHPGTSLKTATEYLVWRPDEEPSPRAPKDPRALRILDPACGSGHFLHYAFELLQVVYPEAWEHPAGAFDRLRADYPDREALERAVPGLILRHNLFGIDIDLRATQLTALSLYLRAKRAHPGAEVRRVNAVLAAPMPGEPALLDDFLASLDGRPNAELVKALLRAVWTTLDALAAEAGSLLRAERTIRGEIERVRARVERARTTGAGTQLGLGTAIEGDRYQQAEMALAVERGTPESFWETLEVELVGLLRRYAESAERAGTGAMARRLFADDAAHGFAFLDVLLHQYDVVLMNPPFGEPSTPSKSYLSASYPNTKKNLLTAFLERGVEITKPTGFVGAITSRAWLFAQGFEIARTQLLERDGALELMADLGSAVLDEALVETAAYTLRRPS